MGHPDLSRLAAVVLAVATLALAGCQHGIEPCGCVHEDYTIADGAVPDDAAPAADAHHPGLDPAIRRFPDGAIDWDFGTSADPTDPTTSDAPDAGTEPTPTHVDGDGHDDGHDGDGNG